MISHTHQQIFVADVNLIHDINNLKDLSLKNKFERFLINSIMKAKIIFGSELDDQKQLVNELHHRYIKNKEFLKINGQKLNQFWSANLIFLSERKRSKHDILINKTYKK